MWLLALDMGIVQHPVHPFVIQMLSLNALSTNKQKRCEVILTLSFLFKEAIDIGKQATHGR